MADVLYIADAVVTGDRLRRLYQGETEIRLNPGTVVTPTGWDFIRQHKLPVSRGAGDGGAAQSASEVVPAPAGGEERPVVGELIKEVPPPQMVAEGRCDHPDRPYGCQTEEFGSGFVEPAACQDCPVHREQREGAENASCEGCNRNETAKAAGAEDLEALVQQITDLVVAQLGED